MPRKLIGETLLNQFRVENFIASGGMATIYRVWDMQRSVPLAMKVLQPELAEDPAFMARFEREARSLQMLVHPHIVTFYGLYRSGELTFLLERFIDGPSLDEVLRRRAGRPLPLNDTLVYFKALYTSLGYAHAQGIIHCDIKPGNVLIDQGGHVYLTDFGIARFADAATTTTGAAIGTPLYMAPEQIRGERVSNRTDIYSLGVLLFELLSGQRPFRGDINVPPGVGENASDRVRYQQLYLPPPEPRMINPNLPEGLAHVVLKAMAKDPAQRYATVQAMADDIVQVIAARFETLPNRVPVEQEMAPPIGGGPASGALGVDPLGGAPGDWAGSETNLPFQGTVIPAGRAWEQPEDYPAEAVPATMAAQPQAPEAAAGARPRRAHPRRWGWLIGLAGLLVLISLCGLAGYRLARGLNLAGGLPLAASSGQTPTSGTTATPKPSATGQTSVSQPPAAVPSPAVSLENFGVNGIIALSIHRAGAEWLYLLDAASGQMTQMPTVPNVNQKGVSAPQWSPDGAKITYVAEYKNRLHVVVMDMTEKEPYQLPAGEAYAHVSSPAFLPDGKQVSFWASNTGGNWMVLADAITGVQVGQVTLPTYRNLFVWNWKDNQLAFVQQRANGTYQVIVSKTADSADQSYDIAGETYAPVWSNDGQWIAFQTNQGKSSAEENEIWVARADGSNAHAVTSSPAGTWARAPTWSPDGKMIAFVSNRSGSVSADMGELFVVDLASGKVRQLTNSGGAVYDWRPAWKP